MNVDLEKQWWVVPILGGAAGLVLLIFVDQLFPRVGPYALALLLALVGLGFLWAFRERDVWWTVAPGVGALACALAVLVDTFLPANNGWIAVLILGAGTFLIAAIPNRRVEVNAAHFVGIAIVVIGILLSPLRAVWKIVLIVVSLLLAAYFAWLDREDLKRLFAS
jgi:hypothetical protein